MPGKIQVSITNQPIDIAAAHAFVADPAHGAVNSFIGAVRQTNLGKDVVGVSYDVFEVLASTVLQQLCEKVAAQYAGKINISLTHFKGRLDVGGISVVIAVSTPHRAESFAACRTLIEELKHQAPIWKQEHYTDGDSEWMQGHALCQHEKEMHHECAH
ncbi:MAG: molybdenum cofactor biosynthesis protein MoaE [Alphaproteobacteria bacterium]|nr:molybdenum cofactor biosynthesis protein MoaE [Alphaproteobacteria bacterium]